MDSYIVQVEDGAQRDAVTLEQARVYAERQSRANDAARHTQIQRREGEDLVLVEAWFDGYKTNARS